MKITKFPLFNDDPQNPARTNMATGEIEINMFAFDNLPQYAKEFVIYHEMGHYTLQTYDEKKADDYALKKMAYRKRYSLRNHIDAVYMIARDDVARKKHALKSVLTLESGRGNKEATELLSKFSK